MTATASRCNGEVSQKVPYETLGLAEALRPVKPTSALSPAVDQGHDQGGRYARARGGTHDRDRRRPPTATPARLGRRESFASSNVRWRFGSESDSRAGAHPGPRPVGDRLRNPEDVTVRGVQTGRPGLLDRGEAARALRVLLPLREEPVQQATLIHDLDAARVQPSAPARPAPRPCSR